MTSDELLTAMVRRVRALRTERGWTLRDLASRSGLSPRFLVQVEGGVGNISVRKLTALAAALGTDPAALLRSEDAPPIVALLGLRGAGKTSVGRRLARRLSVRFVELDEEVERLADLKLAEIFALHGEPYYRRLERSALERLIEAAAPVVLATGGGIVTAPDTYALLRRHAVTLWLSARPEDHWERVVKQGDRRPMADHPEAMQELRRLLREREPLYSKASYNVQTSGRNVETVVHEALAAVRTGTPKKIPNSG